MQNLQALSHFFSHISISYSQLHSGQFSGIDVDPRFNIARLFETKSINSFLRDFDGPKEVRLIKYFNSYRLL
jgi:hypothetical protein